MNTNAQTKTLSVMPTQALLAEHTHVLYTQTYHWSWLPSGPSRTRHTKSTLDGTVKILMLHFCTTECKNLFSLHLINETTSALTQSSSDLGRCLDFFPDFATIIYSFIAQHVNIRIVLQNDFFFWA